jgi:two-component system sensor histidine kinase PhoQ
VNLLRQSLLARLLLASLIALPLSLGATGWYLERAHRAALQAASLERLELQVLALLAQADFDTGFSLPLLPLESRLLQPNSGLYALVTGADGEPLWLSPSAALLPDPLATLADGLPALTPGQHYGDEKRALLRYAYQVLWEAEGSQAQPLRFLVAESTGPRDADLRVYRYKLLLWLLGTLLLLLAVQMLILRWGLLPLRRLTDDIARIESGESSSLPGPWPREVQPLADNLQALLAGEQQRRERMRNTLADLAHSLKTPLAVLRSADPEQADFRHLQDEQLARMEEVIGWHLQRAAGGSHRLLQRTAVAPVLQRLRETLCKVYADRALVIDIDCPDDARFRGDERDLMELLGNLMDNACKYARQRLCVAVGGGSQGEPLRILVEDDGEGISPELRDTLLQRGARADSRREGQGIGLALVLDIVTAQRGELVLGESALGGAAVRISLP